MALETCKYHVPQLFIPKTLNPLLIACWISEFFIARILASQMFKCQYYRIIAGQAIQQIYEAWHSRKVKLN